MTRHPASFGRFYGAVKTEWLWDHHRNMRLLAPVEFVDMRGHRWYAPIDSIIDGASTGWLLRRLFPAYVGHYRRATVLHDVHCELRIEPSWKVHRMFYDAMRADGTNPAAAWIMWLAVRMFGPRF